MLSNEKTLDNTIQNLQQEIHQHVQFLGGYWVPLSALARLTEEVGEVAEVLEAKQFIADNLGTELSDVFMISTCLANQYSANLSVGYTKIGLPDSLEKFFAEGSPLEEKGSFLQITMKASKLARLINSHEGNKKPKLGEQLPSVEDAVSELHEQVLYFAKKNKLNLVGYIKKVLEKSKQRDKGRFDTLYDPTMRTFTHQFSFTKDQNSMVMNVSKIWEGPDWKKEKSEEYNVEENMNQIVRFKKISKVEKLDGFIIVTRGRNAASLEALSTFIDNIRTWSGKDIHLFSSDEAKEGKVNASAENSEYLIFGYTPLYSLGHIYHLSIIECALIVLQTKFSFLQRGLLQIPASYVNELTKGSSLSRQHRVCAIVDGYSAGRLLPERLKMRGYECIHIRSTPHELKALSLKNADVYKATYVYDGQDLDKLISILTAENTISCVIAGSEPGVELADLIACKLGLIRNDDKLSLARRDKYVMVEAIKNAGLKTVRHYKSDKLSDIEKWVTQHQKWPVVLKPLDSAGTDKVFVCHDMQQVQHAFIAIYGSKNLFDRECTEVLVQSYLDGEEYVVNMVSCEGKHFACEVRKYHKQDLNGHHIYDYEEMIDFDGRVQQQLIAYTKKVADAVGIKYGPSHSEIMMTSEGPVLVEIAARMSGATNIESSNACLGHNIVDLTLDSYFDPIAFNRIFFKTPQVHKYEVVMDVATQEEGEIKEISLKKVLENLSSVKEVRYNVKIGDYLRPTISLLTSPVKVFMIHEKRENITQDILEIKRASKTGFVCNKPKAINSQLSNTRHLKRLVSFLVGGIGLYVTYKNIASQTSHCALSQAPKFF